jgi:hypothetical protein
MQFRKTAASSRCIFLSFHIWGKRRGFFFANWKFHALVVPWNVGHRRHMPCAASSIILRRQGAQYKLPAMSGAYTRGNFINLTTAARKQRVIATLAIVKLTLKEATSESHYSRNRCEWFCLLTWSQWHNNIDRFSWQSIVKRFDFECGVVFFLRLEHSIQLHSMSRCNRFTLEQGLYTRAKSHFAGFLDYLTNFLTELRLPSWINPLHNTRRRLVNRENETDLRKIQTSTRARVKTLLVLLNQFVILREKKEKNRRKGRKTKASRESRFRLPLRKAAIGEMLLLSSSKLFQVSAYSRVRNRALSYCSWSRDPIYHRQTLTVSSAERETFMAFGRKKRKFMNEGKPSKNDECRCGELSAQQLA